jgi:hypothetical protein
MNRFYLINFIICFNLDLDQNIGLKNLYLPFGNHPKAKIQIEIQNVIYILLLEFLFLKFDNEI